MTAAFLFNTAWDDSQAEFQCRVAIGPGFFKLGFTLESDFSQALSLYVLGHSIPQQDFFASTYPGFWYLSSLVLPGGQVRRVAACG